MKTGKWTFFLVHWCVICLTDRSTDLLLGFDGSIAFLFLCSQLFEDVVCLQLLLHEFFAWNQVFCHQLKKNSVSAPTTPVIRWQRNTPWAGPAPLQVTYPRLGWGHLLDWPPPPFTMMTTTTRPWLHKKVPADSRAPAKNSLGTLSKNEPISHAAKLVFGFSESLVKNFSRYLPPWVLQFAGPFLWVISRRRSSRLWSCTVHLSFDPTASSGPPFPEDARHRENMSPLYWKILRLNSHRTCDAMRMQTRMFFLWCCLQAVWTLPLTTTGPICWLYACASCVN